MNLASRLHGPHRRSALSRFAMSGRFTPIAVGLLCVTLVAASLEFGHGHLHLITAKIDPPIVVPRYASGPGGQDVLRLRRAASAFGDDPEFLSVTLFPGRGLNVFQIVAMVPGRGDVPLLDSPSVANATNVLTGHGVDSSGASSTSLGAALLAPWAQRLRGDPVAGPSGLPMIQTDWQGQTYRIPADGPASSESLEGLLLNRGAESVQTDVLADGQSVRAVFRPGDFSGDWPSNLELTVQVDLEAHDLDLTMTARNSGSQPMPFGAGWKPLFALPGGGRSSTRLRIPSTTAIEVDRSSMRPTGNIQSVAHTALDFSAAGGALLRTSGIDETYTGFPGGTVAELLDPSTDLRLRLVGLTPNVTSLHVVAPPNKNWIALSPNTNFDDPLGTEWARHSSGIITLAPGQSTQWKIRLEIGRSSVAEPDR